MRLLLLFLLLPGMLFASGARASADPLDAGVRAALSGALPADGLSVIVLLREDVAPTPAGRRNAIAARQQRTLNALPAGALRLGRRHRNLRGFSGRADRDALEALAVHPDVEAVYLDGRVHATLTQGRELVGGNAAWLAGFSGSGVTIAVLDTGIDTDHPDLVGDLVAEACFCDNRPGPRGCCPGKGETQFGAGAAEDDEGHGTAVAGIVTADGIDVSRSVSRWAGVAAVKVLSSSGSGSFSDVDAGLDWVIDNAGTYGIRVVNMSLGDNTENATSGGTPCGNSTTEDAIEQLDGMGISVVVSSGNEARVGGIAFPACVAEAISVGGVYDASLGNVSWCGATCGTILCTDLATQADQFVCHTNSGSLLDVLAPDHRTTTADLGGGSVNFAGTSAAAPYIAAQAALLHEADPNITPAQVRTLLTTHGPLVTNPANGLQHRRSDVAAALTEWIGGPDTDADGVPDDGDGSGTPGDGLCADGQVVLCDDSCPNDPDPSQADTDGDGVGDVCDVLCGNGLDDDGDGLVDYPDDPGCRNASWPLEDPQCNDGIDNDGDTFIDFPADADCTDPWKIIEATPSGRCGLGFELAFLLPLLRRARRRRA